MHLIINQGYNAENLWQYSKYIAWLQQQNLESAKNYWQTLFKGFTETTDIASDLVENSKTFHQKKSLYFSFPLELCLALEEFSREYQLTLSTILQGIWGILVTKYSNQNDVVFGTIISGAHQNYQMLIKCWEFLLMQFLFELILNMI